ncbi:hypothetical protein F1542_13880 [Komagataeibacter sp. FXV3]|nr:hypothetical protein [Komagataeibacter sp. FXV3]
MPDGESHACWHRAVSDMPAGQPDLAWSITAGQHDAMKPFLQGGLAFIPLTTDPYGDKESRQTRNCFDRNKMHAQRPAGWK